MRMKPFKKKTILFVSHESSLSGAPILLLNLLKWITVNANFDCKILLKYGGPLAVEFEKLAPTTLYSSDTVAEVFKPGDIDLVYSNTIANGSVLKSLAYLGCPVITHVHELENVVRILGYANFRQVLQYTSHYIAVCEAVRQNLVKHHGIQLEDVSLIYGFIPREQTLVPLISVHNMKEKLGIPADAFVVGGIGGDAWRTGQDLFIQLAVRLKVQQESRPIHFVWLGRDPSAECRARIAYDLEQTNLGPCVHLVGLVPNPMDYLALFDVLAMTSREDPFPLVNLEAAALQKPVICFADAGGSAEFIGEDGGFVVPYLDLGGFAEKILWLRDNPEEGRKMGERAQQKMIAHHSLEDIAVSVVNVIEKCLASVSQGEMAHSATVMGLATKRNKSLSLRRVIKAALPEKVLQGYYRWRYPNRTVRGTIRDVIEGAVKGRNKSKLCLFAHYDAFGRIDPYVEDYASALTRMGFDLIFISTSPFLVKTDLERMRRRCRVVIHRDNRGLDFASWKAAMDVVTDVWEYDRVLLTNDSIIGPFRDLAPAFERMEKADALMCGLNESFELAYHLQSFFLYLKKPLFAKPAFKEFWKRVVPLNDRLKLVSEYEVGFSQTMRNSGEGLFAAYPFPEILQRAKELGNRFQYHALIGEIALNSTLHMWDILLRDFEYPFIKRDIFLKKRINPTGADQWRTLIPPAAQDLAGHVEMYLERLRREAMENQDHA